MLLSIVGKMRESCTAKDSHIFPTKNYDVFAYVVSPVTVTVTVPVPLLLKFSRSLYLGNHSSESIHTWTIGTQ